MLRHLRLGPADAGPYTEDQWLELRKYAHGLDARERERDELLGRLAGGLDGG